MHDTSKPVRGSSRQTAAKQVQFTVFRSETPAAKTYSIKPDGSVHGADASHMYAGTFVVEQFDATDPRAALAAIGELFEGLDRYGMIGLDVPKDGRTTGKIITKRRHAELRRPPKKSLRDGARRERPPHPDLDAISHSKEFFERPPDLALLLFDGDDIDGLRDLYIKLWPGFADVAVLVRPSGSATVLDPRTGQPIKRGEHCYVLIDEPEKVKDVLWAFMRLAWIKGIGRPRLDVSDNGGRLVHGPLDLAIASAARSCFEGAVTLKDGLTALPRKAEVIGGRVLCVAEVLAYAEAIAPREAFQKLYAEASNDPAFIALQKRTLEQWCAKRIAEETARGVPVEEAEQRFKKIARVLSQNSHGGGGSAVAYDQREWIELTPEWPIHRPDGTVFLAAEMRANPKAFIHTMCADPVEGLSYPSLNCAWIINGVRGYEILSRAHGDAFGYFLPRVDYEAFGGALRQLAARCGATLRGDFGFEERDGMRISWRDGVQTSEPLPFDDSLLEQINEPLPFVDMSTWDDTRAPPRKWLVDGYIPREQPTLISGPGGTGKSILLMQLLVATALGLDWIGLKVTQGPVIYLCAEETVHEVRRRLEVILAYYNKTFADLINAGFRLLTFEENDPALAKCDRSNGLQPTKLYHQLVVTAEALQPKLIAIDTLSDVFIADEIDRAQVRQFGTMMRRLAFRSDASVVTISHPSLTGMNTGSGLSGSTQWHNSVRSRAYFVNPDEEKDKDTLTDNGRRELRFLKNQYDKRGATIELQWVGGGVWHPSTVNEIDKAKLVENIFLRLLERFTEQNRKVSPNLGKTYAPSIFERMPDAKVDRIKSAAFAEAMERLLSAGKIRIETEGPPSRRSQFLVPV